MRFRVWIALVATLTPAMGAAAASTDQSVDLDAVVTYESRSLSRTGVSKTERWQEKLIRRAGHVWIERIVPTTAPTAHDLESPSEHAGHKHFDFDAAAMHLTREANGSPHLEYVGRTERVVVFVPPAEYSAVGFHGHWNNAAFLIPPDVIARMPVQASSTAPGTAWHAERRQGWTTRVLWSERNRFPLQIDLKRDDGAIVRHTKVDLLPRTPDAQLPWQRLESYTHKDYDDFMD